MNTVLLNGSERRIFSKEEASRAGFRPFTFGYHPESELWMMENVAKDMDAAGHSICCVEVIDPRQKGLVWLEIWRRAYHKRF